MPLETKIGTLADSYKKFKPSSILHSDDLMNERGTNEEIRDQMFYAADSALYRVEKGNVFLYLTRGKDNPIFKDIDNATQQLINKQNYVPDKKSIDSVVNSKDIVKVELSKLDLIRDDNEYSHFEVNTSDYDNLNKEQRKFAERVYGSGDDFIKNMKILEDNSISTTRIYVLNPDYVKEKVKEGSAIVRACWLGNFGSDSNFVAIDRDVGDDNGGLRGVLKSAAGACKQLGVPPKGQVIKALKKYILPKDRSEAKNVLSELYKRYNK